MERGSRKYEEPKSPEHRDAYLALTQHAQRLVQAHAPPAEEGDVSRDLGLESETAEIEVEIPCSQIDDAITSISRTATADDGKHAPITYYTQTQDDIWRKQEYGSHQEVQARYSPGGMLLAERPGTFEEVYGQAIDPEEVYSLITELLSANVQE